MIITTNIVVIIICYTIFRMSSNIDWNDVIKKEARGQNGEDFGEVHDVSNGYVFVQKGIINKEKFFIPQDKVESYDGDVKVNDIIIRNCLCCYFFNDDWFSITQCGTRDYGYK